MPDGRLDWLCIGAQKAGTSTLFRLLREHPNLVIPPTKEDPIFDREVSRSEVDRYLDERFAAAPPDARCGTVTPPYMSSPHTAERVHRFAPDVRVVALLRDPVERAFSQYRMSVRRGLEERSFADAAAAQLRVAETDASIDPDSEVDTYVERGRYAYILGPWFELFGPDAVHVEFTADLDAEPSDLVVRVQRFLGVEPQLSGEEGMRAHADPPAHRLKKLRRPVAGALRKVGVLDRIPVERKEQLAETIERGLARLLPAREERVPASTDAALRGFFANDAVALTSLVGRCPPWS